MSTLADELRAHLEDLKKDPGLAVDDVLIENCCLLLPQQVAPQASVALVQQLSATVPTIQQDPTLLNKLLIALLEPFSYSDILQLDQIDFVRGLNVYALPYNRLLLAILHKAADKPSDVAVIAARPEIVSALITLWLSTPETGIAQLAGQVFYSLLAADHQPEALPSGAGQGLMWKRVFQDRDVYDLFYSLCASDTALSKHDLSRNQRTLAQSRLLGLLPALCALDWGALTRSHVEDVEKQYLARPDPSLLAFAVSSMVDTKDDVLMHKCLIEFYADLIAAVTKSALGAEKHSSLSLDFLISSGVHKTLLELYTERDEWKYGGAFEVHLLYSSAARYTSVYASHYADHYMDSANRYDVIARLEKAFDLTPHQWLHQEPPKYDLQVLSSLPRAVLFPQPTAAGRAKPSVISLLPTSSTVPDVLNTLATIFKGPTTAESLTYPEESPMTSSVDERGISEAQAARGLYYLYINEYNPALFADLGAHADTIALTDMALASIGLLTSVINSTWAPLSDQSVRGMLTEDEFESLFRAPKPLMPLSGAEATLTPPALQDVLLSLLKPARPFTNLVGGRGDSESAAYRVAIAKFEALRSLHDRLKVVPGQTFEDIITSLETSLRRGPWGQEVEVGGRVATMEL